MPPLVARFITRTVTRPGGWTPLAVVPAKPSHVEFWETFIQPFIDRLGPTKRADAGWNWTWFINLYRLAGIGQRPITYALVAPSPDDTSPIVCALVLIARNFLYLPDLVHPRPHRKAGFVWLCAAAPPQALRPFFTDGAMPKRLSQLCLDIAVTSSFQERQDGRICLHADPKAPTTAAGTDVLLEFYANAPVGMAPLNPAITIPRLRGLFAENDGRYFYFDEANATVFAAQFDPYR